MPTSRAILDVMMARWLVGAVICLTACSRQLNAEWCASHPTDDDCRNAGLVTFDAPGPQCMTDNECSADKPKCDVPSQTCVTCLPNVEPSGCPAQQFCGDDLVCHGCIVDTNCASLVCTAEGTCADAANVLYASPTGGGDCLSAAAPCTLPDAIGKLSSARYIVKMMTKFGTDYVAAPISIDVPAQQGYQILGQGTQLTPNANGDAIAFTGHLEIVGVRITGATGAGSDGVQCTNGELILRRAELATNASFGARTTGCKVKMDRTKVRGNVDGAILVDTGDIEIRNNWFVQNGNGAIDAGNVQLKNVGGRFVFNTVADNQSKNGNNVGGVACSERAGATVVATRDIITGNGGANNQTNGGCGLSTTTSYINGSSAGVNFASNDYHLTAASPPNMVLNDPLADADCHDGAAYIDDIDGQARPVTFCDRGADEYRP